MNKKKLHFLQLCFIFGAITVFALMYTWGFNKAEKAEAGMMGESMGNMMGSMHLQNLTLNALFANEEQSETMTGMKAHHTGQSSFMKIMHYMTTYSIILLLPLIIAGTIFLAIVWLR